MIQNNGDSNPQNRIGWNVNAPRSYINRDVTAPNEKFLHRERVVLVSIVCLSLIIGLSMYQRTKSLADLPLVMSLLYSLSASAVPMIGLVFAAFLSEVTGRKPVFQYLFALAVFSVILRVSSNHATVMCLIFILDGLVRGGYSVMSALTISEYSSPKHRFAWLIVNAAANAVISNVMSTMTLDSKVLFYVLIVIEIVLGLICFGLIWVWPESPYWLACKGELEQSKKAFIWLRGNSGREELASMLKARRRPGPPKLFWISLLIAFATISVGIFSNLQLVQAAIFYHYTTSYTRESEFYIFLYGAAAFTSLLAAMSYFVKRKLLFIVVSITSFILSYGVALWIYLASETDIDSELFYVLYNAYKVVQTCGPSVFGVTLYIEIVPYKYNTIISCICFSVLFLCFPLLWILSLYLVRETSIHPSVIMALFTTCSLIAALLYYFFAPETKNKTLLEIQRSYTSDESDSIPEQNENMVVNAI